MLFFINIPLDFDFQIKLKYVEQNIANFQEKNKTDFCFWNLYEHL